jgi:tRNA1(Val) A37 N6-methylase TrmN6
MHDYKQPDFYHFTQDSIDLVKHALEFSEDIDNLNIIDIGCGCGIVGLEFLKHYHGQAQLDLVEIQPEFYKVIEENINASEKSEQIQLIKESFVGYNPGKKYDLVVSNPPYYVTGTAKQTKSDLKKGCHFFTKEESLLFIEKIKELLADGGVGYFLGRRDQIFIQNFIKEGLIIESKRLERSSIFKLT